MQKARLYDAKRYQLKILIVKLKGTACKTSLETYLALANVPMWHYEFKPCFWSYKFSPLHRLIHNSLSSLSRTITTCRSLPLVNYYDLAFGPTN